MKRIYLLLLSLIATGTILAQHSRLDQIYRVNPLPADLGRNIKVEPASQAIPVMPAPITKNWAFQKIDFSSSLNANGIFSYEERYVTVDQTSGLFSFGNRAGGVFGNTGNDLKFKFTTDLGSTWDSTLFNPVSGKNYRYPSMIVYNPTGSTNPDDMYGIVSGPIYEASWTCQYFGSKRFDGQNEDINYLNNEANVYLNHMNIDLYCSPDGHVTVASQRLNGTETNYTYDGWEILNGTFNTATHKVDWITPFQKLSPALLEDGRIDANHVVWAPDGSVGYIYGTAVDADLAYNPYGVEWPVIFKTTDHGLTWNKVPAFDFSNIAAFEPYLYPTRMDTTKIIPRWYNKWASVNNQRQNGAVVDMYGNLHLFSMMRSTMSLHPDSLNYFYTLEPMHMFDIYMKPGGGWDAYYVDTLMAVNPPDPGTYGIDWDHQLQMSRTPDGSKVFCAWTDTDPQFSNENVSPDIKAIGYNVVTGMATPVKNFTASTLYWLENWWMRFADKVYYDGVNQKSMLPFTTSKPGATSSDPMLHQFLTGCEIADNEFNLLVGQKEITGKTSKAPVSQASPNPFRDYTTVKVSLDKPSTVSSKLMSITGQTVQVTDHGTLPAGNSMITFNGRGLNPGLYFYTVTVNGNMYSGKVIIE